MNSCQAKPKRSLMLAGGGLKSRFRGVLQVWLDEANIELDHADGVSAECFNLAMWTQGMSGKQIADNWRNFKPLAAVKLNWLQLLRLFHAESIFTLDAFRKTFFPAWGIDWEPICAGKREATFNVYNFSRHELRPVTADELDEDFLIPTASLPLWFRQCVSTATPTSTRSSIPPAIWRRRCVAAPTNFG